MNEYASNRNPYKDSRQQFTNLLLIVAANKILRQVSSPVFPADGEIPGHVQDLALPGGSML
jgi:hypothetical protein